MLKPRGKKKSIVNNESIFCIILEPRNRMTLSSQSLPLWFGALELNNQLSAKNNGSGRWGPRKRLLRQSPVIATPGLPTWGDIWCSAHLCPRGRLCHTRYSCAPVTFMSTVFWRRLVSNHDAALSKPQNGSSRTAETPKERRSSAVTIHRQSYRRTIVSSLGFTVQRSVRRKRVTFRRSRTDYRHDGFGQNPMLWSSNLSDVSAKRSSSLVGRVTRICPASAWRTNS